MIVNCELGRVWKEAVWHTEGTIPIGESCPIPGEGYKPIKNHSQDRRPLDRGSSLRSTEYDLGMITI
jgi:hypothetical protein